MVEKVKDILLFIVVSMLAFFVLGAIAALFSLLTGGNSKVGLAY